MRIATNDDFRRIFLSLAALAALMVSIGAAEDSFDRSTEIAGLDQARPTGGAAVAASVPQKSTWFEAIRPASYEPPPPPVIEEPLVAAEPEYVDLDDFRAEINALTWSKGDYRIIPYGTLWADMIYSSSRQFPGRFIMWIDSTQQQGEPTFHVEARYSRVGVDLQGPTLGLFGGIETGGKVEVDFLGGFTTENQPDLRLRHAYWQARNESLRILVGQYWDVISPSMPNTVNFSINWNAGNIGFRRAQFRLEQYFPLANDIVWTVQAALAQNVIQDFTGGPLAANITREVGSWPMLQGRTAVTLDASCDTATTVGVSAHIGETGFDFANGDAANPNLGPESSARFRTWSFNVDTHVPFTDRFGFHGELFVGANLSSELGGIGQGVCPCLRVPIRSVGGWGELWYDLTSYLHAHVGFGIDDPNNNDSLQGRTFNRVIYLNTFVDVTDRLTTGLEVSFWRTNYHNRTDLFGEPKNPDVPEAPGQATAIDWTVRWSF